MTTTVGGTCRCGSRWSGARAAHCGGCHETFGGVTVFDQHRQRGRCLDPSSLGLERRRNAWRGPEFDVGGLRRGR